MNDLPGATPLMGSLASSIRGQLDAPAESLDPLNLAKLLRIKVSLINRHGVNLQGSLIPVGGGFESEIYRKRGEKKALNKSERLTIAHECGHAFFYYYDSGTPTRIIPRTLEGQLSQSEENLCDHFARALFQESSE
jgi:Zn-dependent peptidase ImmA (M78 family)